MPQPAPDNGFEDRGRHQPPTASEGILAQAGRFALGKLGERGAIPRARRAVIRSAAKSLEDEMTRHALRLSLLPLTLCVLSACDRNPPPPPDAASPATAQTSAAAPAAPPAATSDAGGAPSIPSHTPAVDMAQTTASVPTAPAADLGAGSIDFDLPKAWKAETPKSSMRLAQASI